MRWEALKKRSNGKLKLAQFEAYLWMLPTLALISIFVLFPVLESVYMSFSKVSKAGFIKSFGTLENYQYVFKQPVFPRVILNTVVWTVVIVLISLVISIMLAVVLNERFALRRFTRTMLLFPWATSGFITACVWKYALDYQYGSLNALLVRTGIVQKNINFLGNADSAFAWLIFVGVFVTVPFMTFTLLSGLQSISIDYYEAATIDGANFWDKLFKITLPLLRPAINVTVVLNVIYCFNSFVFVHTITGGAPAHRTDTIMTYLYWMAFSKNNYGPASAISVIGFIVLLFFSVIYMNIQMKEETT